MTVFFAVTGSHSLFSNGKLPTGILLLTSGRHFFSPKKTYLQPITGLVNDLTLILMQIVAKQVLALENRRRQ